MVKYIYISLVGAIIEIDPFLSSVTYSIQCKLPLLYKNANFLLVTVIPRNIYYETLVSFSGLNIYI